MNNIVKYGATIAFAGLVISVLSADLTVRPPDVVEKPEPATATVKYIPEPVSTIPDSELARIKSENPIIVMRPFGSDEIFPIYGPVSALKWKEWNWSNYYEHRESLQKNLLTLANSGKAWASEQLQVEREQWRKQDAAIELCRSRLEKFGDYRKCED